MRHSVALIGLGAIGMGYDLATPARDRVYTHAKALAMHGGFGPLLGIDPDPERRRVFEDKYGGQTFAAVSDALARHQPAVVVIASPTSTHAGVLQEVLSSSSPRAILCEKPLADDLSAARAMVTACEARDVRLYVNYMRRSDPAVAAVKRMLESGEIERPLKGVVWYSKGLIHNGSHLVDLMGHWLGPVARTGLVRRGRCWHDRDPEPDFVLEYDRAAVTFQALWEERYSHHASELLCANGRLTYEHGGERVEWQSIADDPDFPGYRILERRSRSLPADMGRYQLNVVRELAAALEERAATLCSGHEGLQTLLDVYAVLNLL